MVVVGDPEGRRLAVVCYEITETVQYIPDRDSRVMDEVGFRIPRFGFRIPKAKKCWIPDSGFPYIGRDVHLRCFDTVFFGTIPHF